MSYPATQLGGRAFNHDNSGSAEAEYDRLRDLARQEQGKRQHCFDKACIPPSRQAYERGDGAAAHELSEEGKRHGQLMDQYNKQASDYIFRENNAVGRVDGDTIDLHGQYVKEAEEILEQRIRYAQQTGQTHLHVIVGKGNHSPAHVQKIKPKVEEICRELGLQYSAEPNAGRMYINLTGGPADMPSQHHTGAGAPHYQQHGQQQYGGGQQPYGGQQQYGQQTGYPAQHQQYGGQQQHQNQNQNQNQNEELEQLAQKLLPKLFRACRSCCVVM